MRILRTLVSALLIVAGAVSIALWAVSGVVVSAVEDGTAVRAIATAALEEPAVVEAIGASLGDAAVEGLADAGLDLAVVGLDAPLRELVAGAARTPEFRQALLAQVDDARVQFARELTAEDRAPAPLVITVDASGYVNGQIATLPVVGAAAPQLELAPVPVTVMSEERFEDTRRAYDVAQFAHRWGLWVGLGLFLLGLIVSPRTRWFLAKAGLAVAVLAGAAWIALEVWGLETIAGALPGGADGPAGTALSAIITAETVPLLQERLITVGAAAAGVGSVALMIALVRLPRSPR
ncbi:MAG: hypothetical protein ACLGHM_03705 [Actinomycetes bacterium]